METINWSDFDTVLKMREWIESQADPDEAYEKISEAYSNEEEGLHLWVAVAIEGECFVDFSDEFLASKWDPELASTDGEYCDVVKEALLSEVRRMFKNVTDLDVVTSGTLARGSEDAWIDINKNGSIESVSDYWIFASNLTFWNVSINFCYDEAHAIHEAQANFEYVEGSYEELRP
jgi:hypothetical protein